MIKRSSTLSLLLLFASIGLAASCFVTPVADGVTISCKDAILPLVPAFDPGIFEYEVYIGAETDALYLDVASPWAKGDYSAYSGSGVRINSEVPVRSAGETIAITYGDFDYSIKIGKISWTLLNPAADFPAEDSTMNAFLEYGGKYWILEGYINDGTTHYSRSEIWNSDDGANWSLVNSTPPYDPYSAFFTFQGKMYAVAGSTYSSTDGVDWAETDVGSSPVGGPSIILADRVIVFNGDSVWEYSGAAWTELTTSVPWNSNSLIKAAFIGGNYFLFEGLGWYGDWSQTYDFVNKNWVSTDLVNWTLATDKTVWSPRRWISLSELDGKLWVMAGNDMTVDNYPTTANYCNNFNDIYFSPNGFDWYRHPLAVPWAPRHAALTLPIAGSNSLLLTGGTGADYVLYNDMWRMTIE